MLFRTANWSLLKKESCPKTRGLGAVERRSLRTNGRLNLFRFVLAFKYSRYATLRHLRTMIEMWGIISTLHIQFNVLVAGDLFRGLHGHLIGHLSTIFCRVFMKSMVYGTSLTSEDDLIAQGQGAIESLTRQSNILDHLCEAQHRRCRNLQWRRGYTLWTPFVM